MNNKEYVDKMVDNILDCVSDCIEEGLDAKSTIRQVKTIIETEKEMLSLMAVYTMTSYYSAIIDNEIDTVENPIYDMVGGVLISELF
jgi:hypothetical protein